MQTKITMSQIQHEMMTKFVRSIYTQPFFLIFEQKESLIKQYLGVKSGLGEFFTVFWARLSEMNASTSRPQNWEEMSAWDQILWIRDNAIPTALLILEEAEISA